MPRKKLPATFGERGTSVRVSLTTSPSGTKLVRVQWRIRGRRFTESWSDSPANRQIAIAFAEGKADNLRAHDAPPPRIKLAALFDKYVLAHSDQWREATRVGHVQKWRQFQDYASPTMWADLVSADFLDEWRKHLRSMRTPRLAAGMAPSQVVEHVKLVKAVFAFARKRKWLVENPLEDYEVAIAKNERKQEVPEYHPADFAKILAQLDYRDSRQWRAWCFTALAGLLGPRQNSLRHLAWSDLDFTPGDRHVQWNPDFDKRGNARVQPLPRDAVFALRIARVWRRRHGYDGAWVFYGQAKKRRLRDEPATYQALAAWLHRAAKLAGVPYVKFRAMHGLRRMAATTVLEQTGDLKQAGDWIGATDLRVLGKSYLRKRPETMRKVADGMRLPKAAVVPEFVPSGHQTTTAPNMDAAEQFADGDVSA